MSNTQYLKAASNEWAFDVFLDNKKIGYHNFKLSGNNKLVSSADFQVNFLFFNAYKYQHTSVEYWKNDCLAELEANTLENKVSTKIRGHLSKGNFLIEGLNADGEKNASLPACVMTFAYWNTNILKQNKLLNPQNGDYLNINFKLVGNEKIESKGEIVNVKHYHLHGDSSEAQIGKPKLDIDIWYDLNYDWLALRSVTPEGNIINYKRK